MTAVALEPVIEAPAPEQDFENHHIDLGAGLTMHVREYAPLLPETGLPVVCLHGLTRNVKDFELVAPRIASLGRRVLAMSMRGRGESSRDPDPANYAAPVYVQDVIKALDTLDLERAVFIGTSMGGLITMLIAASAPDRIAAAVLNDVGPKIDPAGLNRIRSYVGRGQPVADWAGAAQALRATNGIAFPSRAEDEAFWATFARRTFVETAPGKIEADYDPMIALAFDDAPAAPADATPLFQALAPVKVLVVRGAVSDLLSAEGLAHMRAVKPDLLSVEVPNVGHAPTLEEAESWDALLDFLARVP